MVLPEKYLQTLRLLGSAGELHLNHKDYVDLSVGMFLDFMKVRLRNFDMDLLHHLYYTWIKGASPLKRHARVNGETIHGLSIEYDVVWVGIIPDVPGTPNIIGRSEEEWQYPHVNSYVHRGFENAYRVRATEAIALLKMATDRDEKGQRTEANKKGSHITGVINAYTQFRTARSAQIFKVYRSQGWAERKRKYRTEGLEDSDNLYNQFLEDAFVLVYRYQKKAAPLPGDISRYRKSVINLVNAVYGSNYELIGDEFSATIRKTAFHTITNDTEFPEPQLMVSLDKYEEVELGAKRRAPVDILKHGHMVSTGQPQPRKPSSSGPSGSTPGAAGPSFLPSSPEFEFEPSPAPANNPWGFNSDSRGGRAKVARAVRRTDYSLPATAAAAADNDDDDYEGEITRRTPKGWSRVARRQEEPFWGLPSIRRPKRKVVVYEEDEDEDEEPAIKRPKQQYQTARA
ncbi:hypothetical protein Hte_006310 [Hypoxylon texense]